MQEAERTTRTGARGPGLSLLANAAGRFKGWWRAPDASEGGPKSPWVRPVGLGSGILALVGGLLFFGSIQTQAMFRANEIQTGLAQRNDGGILFAALVASLGLALILGALSSRRGGRRLVAMLGVVFSGTVLLGFHFAFFVNGIIMEENSRIWVQASFLFQDSAGTPIGVFVLSFATLLLIGIGLLSTMSLLTPRLLGNRILQPASLQEHRTRVVLASLLLLLGGLTFALQFFRWAFDADSVPVGGFINTNVIALYYLLAGLVGLGTALAVWRARILVWGDMRERAGRRFRRNHRNLVHLENWIWGTVLLLTLIVMNSAPIFRVEAIALNQVFAADSHGFHMFFLLVLGVYVLHRYVSRALYRHLRTHRRDLGVIRFDGLLAMSLALIVTWIAVPYLLRGPDITPLIQTLVRTGSAMVIILVFALRLDPNESALLAPRHEGLPLLLLAACGLAFLTGIALWGAGNTVLTVYARESGGFLTPESRFLQPYTVLLRIAGAAFLALPPVIALWLLAARTRQGVRSGHLMVIAIGTIVAVNLLFTIQATDPFDPLIGRSDVLIGLYLMQLASTLDTVVMVSLWALTTLATLYAAIRMILMLNGTRLTTRRSSTGRPD